MIFSLQTAGIQDESTFAKWPHTDSTSELSNLMAALLFERFSRKGH